MQNDFCEGGALAVTGGTSLVPIINKLREKRAFELTVFTQDWHPQKHVSFASNHIDAAPFTEITVNYTSAYRICGSEYVKLYGRSAVEDCRMIVSSFG